VLRVCERDGLVFLPYFPLGAGWRAAKPAPVLKSVAEKHQTTVQQVALAWLLHHSGLIAPIPGTSSITHLEENVAAASLSLNEHDLAALT
jgi:pyridoxine 4-dehydrogenase